MLTNDELVARLSAAPVVPVLTVEDADAGPALASALARGGITVTEVTLRTPAALEAITAMRRAEPDLIVGAGTILNADGIAAARNAGAQFLVSPGVTPRFADALVEAGMPALPGVSTAGEAMALLERGLDVLKFFPAEPAGGAPFVKALAGPLPTIRFMPTGGISLASAPAYLNAPNVVAVGGSWIATGKDVAGGQWNEIEAKARAACTLAG